jgi:hypothetical protein
VHMYICCTGHSVQDLLSFLFFVFFEYKGAASFCYVHTSVTSVPVDVCFFL